MTRAAQLARGTATASVAVVLAAFSHSIAGREAPGIVGLALAAIVAVGASVVLIGRRSTPLRTALAVIVSQAAFHLLFGVGAAGGGSGTLVATGSGHHHAHAFADGAAAIAAQAPAQAHPGHTDAAMLVGHAIAALLTIAYLLVLERAVWLALAATVRRFVLCLTPTEPVAVIGVVHAPRVGTTRPRLHGRLAFTALRYRGPPFAFVSA